MKLCLHFDINKTILITDSSIGRGFEASLNSLLSECTWGTFPLDLPKELRKEGDWMPDFSTVGSTPPSINSVSYGTYLEDYTNVHKAERKRLKCDFTNNPRFGESFKPDLEKLIESLKISDRSNIEGFGFLSSGYYHIIPAFFELVNYLVGQEDIDFRLVFRTFGTDTEAVAEEFNLFCTDSHPLFRCIKKINGLDATFPFDYCLHMPNDSGMFKRTSHESSGLHLAYTTNTKMVNIVSGSEQVYSTLMNDLLHFSLPSNPTAKYSMAIRDDYSWWDANLESDSSGKVLLVDKAQFTCPTSDTIIQVFFDDNIERGRAHIVDVRDCQTFAPLPFELTKDSCLHKVEPFSAITDHMYYVKAVQSIVSRYK